MIAATVEEVAELRREVFDLKIAVATIKATIEPLTIERETRSTVEAKLAARAAEEKAKNPAPTKPSFAWCRLRASDATRARLGAGHRTITFRAPEFGALGEIVDGRSESMGLDVRAGELLVQATALQTAIAKSADLATLVADGTLVIEQLTDAAALVEENRRRKAIEHDRLLVATGRV